MLRMEEVAFVDRISTFGKYVAVRDINKEEMTCFRIALSTPTVHVQAYPVEFPINQRVSQEIREFIMSHLHLLKETSKDLAFKTAKFIVIGYDDETWRFFEYCDEFCEVFEMTNSCHPLNNS